jgi:hypothetical protein
MKTNKTIQTLCSILSDCRTDLGDLALHSKDEKYFYAQLRSIGIDSAKLATPKVRHLPALIPENTGQFIVNKVDANNELRGFNVYLKTKQYFFTTLDGFVNADGIPTLVEIYGNEPEKLDRYFMDFPRKRGAMETLFPAGFGWVLMLPSDYSGESLEPLPTFKKLGGHVSVLSYSAAEMQRYVELYKKDSDTKMVLKQ